MPAESSFQTTVNRNVTIAVGILLFLTGSPFLILGAFGLFKLPWEGAGHALLVVMLLGALVGAFSCWTGIKMIFGIRRKDGGLLSPALLRSAGFCFLTMPVLLMFLDDEFTPRSIWTLVELGFYVAICAACFALANRRQLRVLDQETAKNGT